MNAILIRNELDVEEFPQLEREPGVYGIEPFLLRPDADRRIPAPKDSPAVLLVSYALLLQAAPPGSQWLLEAVGPGTEGKERRQQWLLQPPAPKRDNMQPIVRDPKLKLPPGAVDRGLYWVDLGPALRAQDMRAGDQLTLRLGPAQASIKLPVAPPR